jgi:hypothetical protein
MEELCQVDNAEVCAEWHQMLRDRTAHKGVPPGLLAFAATQVCQHHSHNACLNVMY